MDQENMMEEAVGWCVNVMTAGVGWAHGLSPYVQTRTQHYWIYVYSCPQEAWQEGIY